MMHTKACLWCEQQTFSMLSQGVQRTVGTIASCLPESVCAALQPAACNVRLTNCWHSLHTRTVCNPRITPSVATRCCALAHISRICVTSYLVAPFQSWRHTSHAWLTLIWHGSIPSLARAAISRSSVGNLQGLQQLERCPDDGQYIDPASAKEHTSKVRHKRAIESQFSRCPERQDPEAAQVPRSD